MLKFKHLIIAFSLVIAAPAQSSPQQALQFCALSDALVMQTFFQANENESSNSEQNKDQQKKACDDKQQQQCLKKEQKSSRKSISWGKWLTTFHKTPSLHFLDLLELISH